MFENYQTCCTRPLNPPILGDFELLQTPPELGAGGRMQRLVRLLNILLGRVNHRNSDRIDSIYYNSVD